MQHGMFLFGISRGVREIVSRCALVALVLGLMIALVACGVSSASARQIPRPALRISGYSSIVSTLRNLPQFSIQTAEIGDSLNRLAALQQGSIDLAVTAADVTYTAFNGGVADPDHPHPLDNVRGIALLQPAAVHLLVGPHTDPSRGFRGMRVVLGNPGGGIDAALGERLMNSMGTASSDMRGEFMPRLTAVESLLRGHLDTFIVTGRVPQEAVTQALQGGARLLDIKDPEIDRLRVYYPLLRTMVIPPGKYPGQQGPVHTIGVDLLLVCRADLDSNLVYGLTRAYFEESRDDIRSQADPQRAPAVVIPLHPGAARYYREREVRR